MKTKSKKINKICKIVDKHTIEFDKPLKNGQVGTIFGIPLFIEDTKLK